MAPTRGNRASRASRGLLLDELDPPKLVPMVFPELSNTTLGLVGVCTVVVVVGAPVVTGRPVVVGNAVGMVITLLGVVEPPRLLPSGVVTETPRI